MKSVAEHIWKGLQNHVKKGHRLRVQVADVLGNDLEIFCVFCGVPLAIGSPAVVDKIGSDLKALGVDVVRPVLQNVRLH